MPRKPPTQKKSAEASIKNPIWSKTDAGYWKRMFSACSNNRKDAWRKYYSELGEHRKTLYAMREMVTTATRIPKHIKDEYKRLVTTFDASKAECPICLDVITFDDSDLTECGHMFHRECLDSWLTKHDECPSCRKPTKKHSI